MAISRAAAKQKGRQFEQEVVDAIRVYFPALTDEDVRKVAASCSGSDVILSDHAKKIVPVNIEAKRRKSVGLIYDALDQAHKDNGLLDMVAVRADRRPALAVVRLDLFLDMLAALDAATLESIRERHT